MQLPVSPSVPQASGTGAGATAATAFSADGGDGLEGAQGLNFGAILGRQMKGVAALLERGDAEPSGASAETGEGGDPAAGSVAPAVSPFDFSALSAAVQATAAQATAVQATAVQAVAVQHGPDGKTGAPALETDAARPVLDLPRDGNAGLAAEIAGNGKNLPQPSSAEKQFAEKLVSLVDAAPAKGERQPLPDLTAAAAYSPAGMADAAAPLRQPDPPPALPVAPRVGAAEWGGAVGEKVLWMANQNHQVAELHLNPPSLGPLEVRLTVSNDQASALFVSHHSAVREAIETALPRLREMLADSGIMLGNAMVSSESFSQQQAFDQQSGREGGRGTREAEGVAARIVGQGKLAGRARAGMVDIFA